jgi:hypothetical protein
MAGARTRPPTAAAAASRRRIAAGPSLPLQLTVRALRSTGRGSLHALTTVEVRERRKATIKVPALPAFPRPATSSMDAGGRLGARRHVGGPRARISEKSP